MPLGSELGLELAREFDLPESYALAQLADAVSPKELNSYFQKRLRNCKASAAASRISDFVWRYIFLFNVDDVVNSCYLTADRKQNITLVSYREAFRPHDDIGELHVVHLHGSVRIPDDGYVFSMQQYGATVAADSVWFKIAADQLLTQPSIVVGCALSEPDLEYYLARRNGLTGSTQQVAPSIFVTRTLDRVLEQRCKRFGLIPVASDSDSFIRELADLSAPRPTPYELISRGRSPGKDRAINEKFARVFYRQWLHATADEFPFGTTSRVPFLRGTEPTWAHILAGEDVIRRDTTNLVARISPWVLDSTRPSQIDVICSTAGEGKTAVLMRTCLELARSNILSYYFVAFDAMADNVAVEVLRALGGPVILFVDSLAEHASQVAGMIEALNASGIRFYLVGAERFHRIRRVETAFARLSPRQMKLRSLQLGEAVTLIQKMRTIGLLGRHARDADEILARRLVRRDLLAAIVSLESAGHQFDVVVQEEWTALESDTAKRVYATIALAHACGYPVQTAILQRASSVPAVDLFDLFSGELKGNIINSDSLHAYVETRHRVVAEILVRSLNRDFVYDLFVSLARAIAPYVSRVSIKRGTVEARLSRRLFDYDDTVRPLLGEHSSLFYEEVCDEWKWNSRYWEQRALLELQRDLPLALQFAEQAVGIETHPYPLTTLAKVHIEIAKASDDVDDCGAHLLEGVRYAEDAIRLARTWRRRDVYPYDVVIRGVTAICEMLSRRTPIGTPPEQVVEKIREFLADPGVERLYPPAEIESLRRSWSDVEFHLNL